MLMRTILVGLMLVAASARGEEPADMVPKSRPRILLGAEELSKRIEWAKPGGPLNGYLEKLKKTVATDNRWRAWYRPHPALIYLLTGEEEFAKKAYEKKVGDQEPVVYYAEAIIYDWLVAGDEHWKKNAFPETERRKMEELLAEKLKSPGSVYSGGNA